MRTALFAWSFLVVTALAGCPPSAAGEGEGAAAEGEGAAGEGEGGAEGEGAGEGEGEGAAACGAVTTQGTCDTATRGEVCDADGSLISFDCATVRDDAVCFSVNAAYGVDCGVPTDAACFDDTTGALPCAGDGFACSITSRVDGFCVAVTAGCDVVGACIDDRSVRSCLGASDGVLGQATLVDCASFDAACADGAGCVVDAGATCTPGFTECGTPDDHAPCPGDGLCPAAAGEGEGEGEGEGGQ